MQTQYFWNTGKLVDKKTLFFFQKSKYLKNCKSVTWTGFSDLENKSLSRVPNIKKIIWNHQLEVVLRLQIIIFVFFFFCFFIIIIYIQYMWMIKKLLYRTCLIQLADMLYGTYISLKFWRMNGLSKQITW